MSERAAHLVTHDGRTFAAVLSGDTIDHAIEVWGTDPNDLADQVEEAMLDGDVGLADWLTEELAWGRAAVIGAYFEVNV